MKKTILAVAAATLTVLPIASAYAKPPRWAPANGYRANNGDIQYRRTNDGVRYWQGQDGRYYCKRNDGTTGLLIGAAAGALAGRAIDTRGERATGTILGAAAGALLGREVEKGMSNRCR